MNGQALDNKMHTRAGQIPDVKALLQIHTCMVDFPDLVGRSGLRVDEDGGWRQILISDQVGDQR
jgi:hypothetical protein